MSISDNELFIENNEDEVTVSGNSSDVRTYNEPQPTTEYINYTDLLESIDGHLKTIETTYTEQSQGLFDKPFNDYTVLESCGIIISICLIMVILLNFIFD